MRTSRRLLPLLLLIGGATVVAGCSYFRGQVGPYRPPPYYRPPESAAAGPFDPGQQLYQRDCGFCHGVDGRGTDRGPDLTVGTVGPALVDFVLRTGRMPIEKPVEQMMPGDPHYTDAERAAIVAYITRQFHPPGPDIPRVDPHLGNLAQGQEVYSEQCAACHATTGIGGAMLIHPPEDPGKRRGIVIPGFEHTDELSFAEAVRAGPGSMPVFSDRVISDDELNSLLRYLLYLQNPEDHGGTPLARIGPVAEGAAGWILGLGALMLFIRWIGTKAGEV